MHKYILRKKTGTAAAACLLLLVTGCSKPEEKEPEPVVPVQTAPVQRSEVQRVVKAQGILYAINQAALMPKISAPVRQFFVHRGDHVRQGQLLAELENRDLAAAAVEAKGNLDQAEANLKSVSSASLPDEVTKSQNEVRANKEALDAAQKVLESRKMLFEQGALPRKQLDEAQVAYVQAHGQHDSALKHLESLQKVGGQEQIKAAQAQVEAARGRWQGAEAQLEYSKIASPIDGVVTDRPLYPGEMASAGTPLLTVMDVSRVVARASVPVVELRFCKVGDSATIASTRFASASDFDVNGQKVTTTATTTFVGGTVADLKADAKVEVEGALDASGTVVATKVSFEHEASVRVSGLVAVVDATAGTLKALGTTFIVTASTRVEDKTSSNQFFKLADLHAGDFVEVSGYVDPAGSGSVVATRLERDMPDDQVEIRGPADQLAQPTFKIVGTTVETNGATKFEDGEADLSATDFFTQAVGQTVDVEGSWNGSSVVADKAQIEHED